MSVKSISTILLFSILCGCIQSYNLNRNEEEYETFIEKFYTDSLFQLSRIKFPLEGFNSDEYNFFEEEVDDSKYFWKKKNWIMLKSIDKNSKIKFKITKNDSIIKEENYIPDSGFIIEKRFKRTKGKWYLIFYFYQNS